MRSGRESLGLEVKNQELVKLLNMILNYLFSLSLYFLYL